MSGIDPSGLDYHTTQQGNTINVTASITLYGQNATSTQAQIWQDAINSWWNNFGNYFSYGKCKVKFDITVQADPNHSTPFTANDADNYVYVVNWKNFTSRTPLSNFGVWNGADVNDPWDEAHEAGHLFGFDDQYTNFDGISYPNSGHKGEIMGDYHGLVSQDDINQIVGNKSCGCK